MRTTTITPSVFYFGTPVALISTLMPDGSTTNITPISSVWALGDTYVLGFGNGGQAIRNLQQTGELVINLADATLQEKIERIAATTGAREVPTHKRGVFRHEPDKWRLGGFSPVPSEDVRPARIQQCPVQIEARVRALTPLGDEATSGAEATATIVQAQVVRVHVHAELALPGTSHIDLDRWRPLYYTFRHYFQQGDRVGVSFRAEQ